MVLNCNAAFVLPVHTMPHACYSSTRKVVFHKFHHITAFLSWRHWKKMAQSLYFNSSVLIHMISLIAHDKIKLVAFEKNQSFSSTL